MGFVDSIGGRTARVTARRSHRVARRLPADRAQYYPPLAALLIAFNASSNVKVLGF